MRARQVRSGAAFQVWEVTAQLIGLACSVAVLRLIESSGEPESVLWVWVVVQVYPTLLCFTVSATTERYTRQFVRL